MAPALAASAGARAPHAGLGIKPPSFKTGRGAGGREGAPARGGGGKKPGKRGKPGTEKRASIKQQIRGIERLLKRDMPAEVKEQHEARLKALHQKIVERKHSDLERKMSKKYHMVKFFERKNIKKGIRQVERKMQEAAPQDIAALKQQQKQLLEDLEYVENFPRDRPYMSVLKTPDRDRVDKMRETIKELMHKTAAQRAEERRKDALGSEDEEEAAQEGEEEDDFFVDEEEKDVGGVPGGKVVRSGWTGDEEEEEEEEEDRKKKKSGNPSTSKKPVWARAVQAAVHAACRDEDGEGGEDYNDKFSSSSSSKKKRDKRLPDRNRKAKKPKAGS